MNPRTTDNSRQCESTEGHIRHFLEERTYGRFLAVGIGNTVFGLGFFPVLHLVAREALSFDAALVISYVVCNAVSFMTHRFITFQSHGGIVAELARYALFALITYLLNKVLLALLVGMLPLPLLGTQMLISVMLLVVTFFGLGKLVFPQR